MVFTPNYRMYKLNIGDYTLMKGCKMNRIILLLLAVTIGLSAQADYSFSTVEPAYQAQPVNYSTIQSYGQSYAQPYTQSYAQPYSQQYNQGYNPYLTQCQGQYVNPYQYRNPYAYGNNVPYSAVNSALSGLRNTNGSTGVVKNIGQSVLFSLLRGY